MGTCGPDVKGEAQVPTSTSARVLDLDIKGFFDNIDHELMMRAVRKHTNCRWTLLYIERWLRSLEPATPETQT